jgi:phosphomannomutase
MVLENSITFDEITQRNINIWLNGNYDAKVKEELALLIKEKPEDVVDAFYRNLEFGTGGLRGLMGIGSNRLNQYTVMGVAQALANYVIKQNGATGNSIFITYDSRHNSQDFAIVTAKVLAANGIKAYLFKELRPLSIVSFACRLKKCQAAVMVTASHCVKEYNGYKVFWEDGAQVLPPHDVGIIDEVTKVLDGAEVLSVDDSHHHLIEWVGEEIDTQYIEAIATLQHFPEENSKCGDELNIVYTSLHGAGITMIPKSLASWGFTTLSLVEEQKEPDGDFPTVTSPNPEEQAALALGIKQMLKEGADIIIGTDPDSDRIGVAVNHHGESVLINGNQMAALCTAHVCESLLELERFPENGVFVKTIVTTELVRKIVESYGRICEDVLTGFKYIAEKIRSWEEGEDKKEFLFGGEESYGYLLGSFVRDKDAVVLACLICEMALIAKRKGKTLVDNLYQLFRQYGVHHEELVNIKFADSKEGARQRESMMKKLRSEIPEEICGVPVLEVEDYLSSSKRVLETGETVALSLPTSNVLRFWLQDGTKITLRPSGTEPKVKLYIGVASSFKSNIEEELKEASKKAKEMGQFFKDLL